MIDYEKMLSDPAFQTLGTERVESFLSLLKRIDGKSIVESMMYIMDFWRKTQGGKPVSKHEQAAMIRVMMENLPDKERAKFSQILLLMNSMEKN